LGRCGEIAGRCGGMRGDAGREGKVVGPDHSFLTTLRHERGRRCLRREARVALPDALGEHDVRLRGEMT